MRQRCPVCLCPSAYSGTLRLGAAPASCARNALIWRRVKTAVDPVKYQLTNQSLRDAAIAIAKAAATAIILLPDGRRT
jgi:hypothetical protein